MERLAIWLGCIGIHRLPTSQRILLINKLLQMDKITEPILSQFGLSFAQIQQFFTATKQIDIVLHWLEQPCNYLITINDERYPVLLAETVGCPLLLYVRGCLDCLQANKLAIVGSRACSHYGKQWAQHFADVLSNAGLVITSGLAVGIDAIAHQSAVANEKPTLAVLGNGLNSIYPMQHRKLADQILATQGALVSEFPLDAAPLAKHFPRRNRIISGLSQAVLVVEATKRSGSLITRPLCA
jgi:DNA processing protein